MLGKYILKDKVPVPCDNLIEWADFFENAANRIVAKSQVGKVKVSTVFLGIDHQFGEGVPLLFETMIFGGDHNEYQTRAATWDEAEKQHQAACLLVKGESQ